ncbi:MAG TPA: replicative DNA helicase [Bacteroidales bacterium]|nr:replicative DNA helicase [Bacteroidales bacterium]HRZ50313.1 replicative DNA helicase [Bacteroidales bacterium]
MDDIKKTREARGIARSRMPLDPTMAGGKIPPQATDLEEVVLGASMIDQNALNTVIDTVRPEMFYKESHGRIFNAVRSLFSKQQPVDLLTVTSYLKQSGELELVGGPFYLTQLTARIASAANVGYYAYIILQKYLQRELIRISGEIIQEAFEDTTDVLDLLDRAETDLYNVSQNNIRKGMVDMHSLIKEAVYQIEEARKHEGHISGVPSGFAELDNITAGWQKSDLIILAARPGMGKTAFVLTLARNIAIDYKRPVAVFSLEMSAVQLITRLIASEAEIESDKLRKGKLEEHEWAQLMARLTPLTEAKLFIDDTPALSVFELRTKARRLKALHDIQIIIVDYLQLMTITTDREGGGYSNRSVNREQEISTISRALKSLAKELNVPVICLSQLNRSVETRGGNKRPQLSDLRESGAIEQDADMVMFIYRPEYYKIDEINGIPSKGVAELIIAKHRNGRLEDVNLKFVSQFARFENPDPEMQLSQTVFNEPGTLAPSRNFEGKNTITRPSKMNQPDDTFGDDPGDAPF